MSIEYCYSYGADDEEEEIIKFVSDNSDSVIMSTFGDLWSGRHWWRDFPVLLALENDEIVGMHAFTTNTKALSTLKTYYILTARGHERKGIAKKLILAALREKKYICEDYYVNSEENSPGVGFFKKLLKMEPALKQNEFGTFDAVFVKPIQDILNEQTI